MLEELDLIDWGKLRHAYGPATDVPGLLRDLASTDAGVRDAVMYKLSSYRNLLMQKCAHAM